MIKESVIHIKSVCCPWATCTRRELISKNCCNKPPCSHLNTAFTQILGQNVWLWKPLLDNKIIALGLQSSPRCRWISPAVPKGSCCFFPILALSWSGWYFLRCFGSQRGAEDVCYWSTLPDSNCCVCSDRDEPHKSSHKHWVRIKGSPRGLVEKVCCVFLCTVVFRLSLQEWFTEIDFILYLTLRKENCHWLLFL